ncbi:MAG TPA: DNRLRE domain-containing protein [Thermoplasmata archaeon]|nr:DNRLRE domain-containing protein [Thermoplasmata archaeon]
MHRGPAASAAVLLLTVFSLVAGLQTGSPRAAADPWLVDNPDGTSLAVWNFTTPGDYALSSTELSGGVANLRRQVEWWNSTTAADFAAPDSETNVDRAGWPGSIALAATSGPSTLLSLQPGATGVDAWLDRNNANQNHGADTTMILDGRNPQSRPVLWFDLSGLPGSAVIDDATLNLYQSAGIGPSFTGSVHPVTAVWSELQVSWNDRLTGTGWATAGGDYNSHAVDARVIDNALGWRSWNVTPLVDLWYRARIPNEGLILVASNPGSDSDKTFYSSDYNVDPTRRPRLDLRYRVLGATGEYISKIGGPGTSSNWRDISWNATTRSLVSDEFGGPALDPKWTWTNPPPTYDVGASVSGHLHIVSGTFVDFAGAVFTGHVLADGVVGDFTATLKMTSNPTAAGQKAGLMVLVNQRDWYAVQKTFVNPGASVNWRAVATADAASAVRVDVVSGNPNPTWLQIVRVGNAFITYTSADGVAWTLLDAYTPAFEYPLEVRLAVLAADGGSGVPHTVDVDFLRVTHGTDATVSVQTRIGNTNPVDGTWSGWSAPYGSPSGSPMVGAASFVEFRLALAVNNPDHGPVVGDLNLSWSRFASAGTLETADLLPSDLAAWGDFTVVQALNGQTITYGYSTDSGGVWTPVALPASLQSVSTASGKIRFRATLSTTNTLASPTLSEMRLTYGHRLDHFYVTASAVATAGSPFTVTVTAKDASNATMTAWSGSVSLEARLLDGITPGGGILGTTSVLIASGGSATLAAETYTKAEPVRIWASFGAAASLSTPVFVGPGPVARIVVTPDNVTFLFFDAQAFTGQGFDGFDNPIPGLSFTWTTLGGLGSLNTTAGLSVTFTAGAAQGNGTLEARSGAAVGVAQIRVVSGTRPWIAIGSPVGGDHVSGIVPIGYTNSTDAVSVRFEHDGGSGWTLIGSTATLDGTYVWDTSGLDFAGGGLRAIVTNARTVTNTTAVSPLEVDNTAPTIALGNVADEQGTSGTLTITYTTAPDTIRAELSYFDGTWNPIGLDPSVDGTYVWTPAGPVNGVTLRIVAADEVGLLGSDERTGIGSRTTGVNPPRIETIPDLHVRIGAPYSLNLTFYVSDADTVLAALAMSVSDTANVTVNAGPYPGLSITFGASGTYTVTLWVSDGTDTAWVLLRIVAGAGIPPAASSPLPPVVFDEDTAAYDALGAPLSTYFMDPDGEALTFEVLGAFLLSSLVYPNGSLLLTAPADWSGTESLRIRATDPTSAFAEAGFLVRVLPVNDAPAIGPIPELRYEAGTEYVLDLRDYVTDVDHNLTDLVVTTDSPYILLEGFVLWLRFPADWDRAEFTITVFDGLAASTQLVRASLLPSLWRSPVLLALPSAGVVGVIALFAQRTRWRPAKAFLVDETGQLLREFTLDPACTVTYEQVVDAGGLDAQEKPIKVSRYHVQTVAGDALAVVLLAYGPVTPDQIEFAREMLVSIQDKFDLAVKVRLEDARTFETRAEGKQQAMKRDRAAFAARSKAFAGAMDAITAAQSKIAAETKAVHEETADLEGRESRLRQEREDLDRLASEVGDLRESLEKRFARVEELEADTTTRATAVRRREERVGPLETSLQKREKAVAEREADVGAQAEVVAAKVLDIETRDKTLEPRETHVREAEASLEAKAKELDGLRAFVDARSGQVQSQEIEVANRMTTAKALEERVGPLESEIARRETAVAERETTVQAMAGAAETKASDSDRAMRAAQELEARTDEERRGVEARAHELEDRQVKLDNREAELGRLEGAIAGRSSDVKGREERLAPLETELSIRLKAVEGREAEAKGLGDRLAATTQDLDARSKAIEETERKSRDGQARAAAWQQQLDERNSALERRAAEVRAAEEDGARRATDIATHEERLRPREEDVARREKELEARETDTRALAEALAVTESQLDARARGLDASEKDLATRRKGLDDAGRSMDARLSTVETQTAELARREQAVVSKVNELNLKAAQLAEREGTVAKGESALGDRAESLVRKGQALDERERTSHERMKKVELLETALARDQAALAKDREALGAAAKELETRTSGFSAEIQRRVHDVDERRRAFEEDVRRFAEERSAYEEERTEKTQWIASKEIDLEAREQSVAGKEVAVRGQAEENARHLADLSPREEAIEIETDKLDKTRAELETRKADLDRMSKSLEARTASLRDEESRKAEEFRTWQSTLDSEQTVLKDQRETFEKEIGNQREMWADRMLRVQMKEQEVSEREAKIRTDVEWIARNEDELNRRERTVAQSLRETQDAKAQIETIRQDLEARSMEVESRDRSLREEAARAMEDLAMRTQALEEERAAFEQARAGFERASGAKSHELQTAETELTGRTRTFERKDSELKEREARTTAAAAAAKKLEERLQLELADLHVLKKQLGAKQTELDQVQRRNDETSARLQADVEAFRQAVAAKEAELESQRERVARDSNTLQEKLGTKAQELATRERSLAARDSEVRAGEQRLEARLRELESKERQVAAQSTELEARSASLAKGQKDLDERTGHLETTAERLSIEEAQKRREWQNVQQNLKEKQEQVDSDATTRFTEIGRQMSELENREKTLTSGLAQLEIERAKLADGAKAQTRKDADAEAAWSRAEKRQSELRAMEEELLRGRHAFESERADWTATRANELRQLEETRDASGEQTAQAERLIVESQRRLNAAEDAERSAKRLAEEASALQGQLQARRVEADNAQKALRDLTVAHEETARSLAVREKHLAEQTKAIREREERTATLEQHNASRMDELKTRQSVLEGEAVQLARERTALDSLRKAAETRASDVEAKFTELAQRERVLNTELQRAENLMIDLGRKEAELKGREKSLATAAEEGARRQMGLADKEAQFQEGMRAVDRLRDDIEDKRRASEEDRQAAAKARSEAALTKDEAEKAKAQSEAMQAEVSKNMKFLQKKAVDVLDREEQFRERDQRVQDAEKALEARAEILESKARALDDEREQLRRQVDRLEGEASKLKDRLAEAERSPPGGEDIAEAREDIETRVKIIQKKAFDLLDREEKLRKRERELKTRAQELGVEV